jgi:hypothetical protein
MYYPKQVHSEMDIMKTETYTRNAKCTHANLVSLSAWLGSRTLSIEFDCFAEIVFAIGHCVIHQCELIHRPGEDDLQNEFEVKVLFSVERRLELGWHTNYPSQLVLRLRLTNDQLNST